MLSSLDKQNQTIKKGFEDVSMLHRKPNTLHKTVKHSSPSV